MGSEASSVCGGLPVTWVLKPKNFRESCRAARPSGYEGKDGGHVVQAQATNPEESSKSMHLSLAVLDCVVRSLAIEKA